MAFEDTPEYRDAHATYVADVAVAERGNDEMAKMRAELSWERTQNKLRTDFTTKEQLTAKREAAVKEVKEKYPTVSPKLLEHVQDPEVLLELAKDMHDKITAGGGDWGAPGGAPGGATSDTRSKNKVRRDLVDRVNTGSRQAIDEYKRMVMEERILPFVERTNNPQR